MDIAGYFESVKDRILTDSSVLDLKVLKEVDRSNNGHLRARVLFTDKSVLKFSEFIEQNANDEIRLVTYSHHWFDENGNLIRRWDNAPHFPKLQNAPYHVHIQSGETEEVAPGKPIDIFRVMDEIASIINE